MSSTHPTTNLVPIAPAASIYVVLGTRSSRTTGETVTPRPQGREREADARAYRTSESSRRALCRRLVAHQLGESQEG